MPPVYLRVRRKLGTILLFLALATSSVIFAFLLSGRMWSHGPWNARSTTDWKHQARSLQSNVSGTATTFPVQARVVSALPPGKQVDRMDQVKVESAVPPGKQVDQLSAEHRLSLRRESIKTACERFQRPLTTKEKRMLYATLVVDDVHRSLWCAVRKSGTRSWRAVMLILGGKFSNVSAALDHASHHDFQYLKRLSAKYRNPRDIEYRLKHYTKFMSFREPLGRLVSDYRQISLHDTSFRTKKCKAVVAYNNKISANKGGTSRRTDKDAWKNISFPQFVNYVTRFHGNKDKYEDLDGHWRPMNLICYPCQVDYDYYIDFESTTVTDDSSFILKALGAPQWLEMPKSNPSGNETKYSFLSQLSASQYQRLLSLYDGDYEIFGHQRPDQNG